MIRNDAVQDLEGATNALRRSVKPNLFKKLPDLHVHLNGAIPTSIIKDLVREHQLVLPQGFEIDRELQVLEPVELYTDYFRPWRVFRLLPKGRECLRRMVFGCLHRLSQDGVDYVELRTTVMNIATINNISYTDSLEWLIDSVNGACSAFSIDARLLVSFDRATVSIELGTKLLDAIASLGAQTCIVGLDLTGDENMPVANDVSRLFRRGKDDLGLGISLHAGERGNIESIRWAIEDCHADRIGHGLAAAGCPKVLEQLRDKDICVEVCLTGNLRTRLVRSIEDHPIFQFEKFGVPFTLASDNPAMHDVPLSDDYALLAKALDVKSLKVIETGYRYSFKS